MSERIAAAAAPPSPPPPRRQRQRERGARVGGRAALTARCAHRYTTAGITHESVAVLMEAAPSHFDVEALSDELKAIPGVGSVSSLHVW